MLLATLNDTNPDQLGHTSRCPTCADFEVVHENLIRAMAEMANATQPDSPNLNGCTTARWKLSKANRARRDLWEKVHIHLRCKVSREDAEVLKRLANANAEQRSASRIHIGRWSAEAVDADWLGYCEASRTIRWKMMSLIRHERRDLMPILHQSGIR
jgi:hypothetical protein